MAMQINLDGIQTANNVKRHINGTTTTKNLATACELELALNDS